MLHVIRHAMGMATNTHSEYVILTAFQRQQYLYKRASILRHTYTACLLNLLKTKRICVI